MQLLAAVRTAAFAKTWPAATLTPTATAAPFICHRTHRRGRASGRPFLAPTRGTACSVGWVCSFGLALSSSTNFKRAASDLRARAESAGVRAGAGRAPRRHGALSQLLQRIGFGCVRGGQRDLDCHEQSLLEQYLCGVQHLHVPRSPCVCLRRTGGAALQSSAKCSPFRASLASQSGSSLRRGLYS